jgi:hypothetical protein
MSTKAMQRAERSARAITHGPQILELVRSPKVRARLIAAADSGTPPVTAISAALKSLVGPLRKDPPIKQFAGLCVRAVLEAEGFEVAEKGVRLSHDPMFRTASVYKRTSVPGKTDELLVRFIASLTDAEARQALQLLKNRR